MCEIETEEEAAHVWERMPDEPGNWYARFETFRLLGPSRTVSKMHRRRAQEEGLCSNNAAGSWYSTARKWRWHERAEAWDRVEQEKIRVRDSERRTQAHKQRLGMIDVMLGVVFTVLQGADLGGMNSEEARKRLPTIRLLFKDLINAQRDELGMPVEADDGDGPVEPFTADELLAAQRELEEWREDEGVSG